MHLAARLICLSNLAFKQRISVVSAPEFYCSITAIPIFDGSLACDVASSSTWLTPSDPQIRCRSFVALKASHMTHPFGVWQALIYLALRELTEMPTVPRPALQNR